MDNIVGKEVFHKIFGTGKKKGIVSVQFGGNVRKFSYPDAFKQFLTIYGK